MSLPVGKPISTVPALLPNGALRQVTFGVALAIW